MAVDTNSLAYLIDPFWQGEGVNGKPLVAGYMCVYIAGTDQKYITWQNWDGTRHPFKIPLGSDGRATILVEVQYTYDCYLYDSFGNLVCSRLNVKPAIGGDVTVYGLTEVWHDGSMSGEGTPQSPLSVVSAGKVYDGIEPIVVNNIENKISAQHIPLGVQEPLYFVEDSETACIIGFSGQTVPEGVMTESALGFEDNKITGYNGSAFSAGNEYEAGSYIDIDNNTISVTGLQPEGDYAYNSALSSKLDVTALPQDLVHSGDLTAYQPVGDYLSATDSANFLLNSDSGNFYPMTGNPSGFLTAHQSLEGYATEQWVEDKGYITGIDIQESAGWNEATTVVNNNSAIWNNTTNVVSSNSAQWGATNPQIPVTGINGIKISESGDKVVFEVSADYALADDLTSKQDSLTFGYKDTAISSIDESALYDNSAHARITTLAGRISDLSSNKLDTTAFSDVSGTFLTAHQDLSDYQTTAGMTAYQEAGDYYSASNPSGFISEVPAGTLNESAFEYDANNKISGYNGSAFAGEGTAGVSGTNVIFVPDYEGVDWGKYYSATISGDVIVTTGQYYNNGAGISPGRNYSLSAIGSDIGNKLDKNKIEDSNTIKIIDNHAEVTDKAYRPVGFSDMSATHVDIRDYRVDIEFNSQYVGIDSRLVSAIVTVETTASGSDIGDGWSLVSYENNSAIFTKSYPLNERVGSFNLYAGYGGWGDFTNAEGSATVYSALELATLAFKDEISGITYTTGSI